MPIIVPPPVFATRLSRNVDTVLAVSGMFPTEFQVVDFDDAGMFDPLLPTRLTIPPGFSRAIFNGCYRLDGSTPTNGAGHIRRNGTNSIATNSAGSGFNSINFTTNTGIIPVSEGEYFEHIMEYGSGTNRTLTALRNRFSCMLFV